MSRQPTCVLTHNIKPVRRFLLVLSCRTFVAIVITVVVIIDAASVRTAALCRTHETVSLAMLLVEAFYGFQMVDSEETLK